LKNHKSPREDEIQAEFLKKEGDEISFRVWKLICRIWTNEELPAKWKTAVLCPIHKKGNKQDYNNYKVIALLNVTQSFFKYHSIKAKRYKAEEILDNC